MGASLAYVPSADNPADPPSRAVGGGMQAAVREACARAARCRLVPASIFRTAWGYVGLTATNG